MLNDTHRILSRPLRVLWAGWETNTHRLQQAGWQLSALKKHFLGLSDNVNYFSEQLDAAAVSFYHYRVTFKPKAIIPNIDVRN